MGRTQRHPRHPRRPGADPIRRGPDLTSPAPGAVPSPNIWHHPAVYEIENQAIDPERRIEATMTCLTETTDWSACTFLDLGCGSGFHLPAWSAMAKRVVGVEPHPSLVAMARRRTRRANNVEVLLGTAQQIPLPDASVDIAQARWAYFFGPGCEPGLAELSRVMRRGGTAFVVDNDATRSTFGGWFRRGYPTIDSAAVERFWSTHGWQRNPVEIQMAFDNPADLAAVVAIEFPEAVAHAILTEIDPARTQVDYAVNVWSKRF